MRRSTTREIAGRSGVMVTRGTIEKADDSKMMQEAEINLLHDEQKTGVERFQGYGFSSVPLPPSEDNGKKRHAEAIALSVTGNRSHPVIIAVDDRRHRPKNLQPGESAHYDDQGQIAKLGRDGYTITAKKITLKVGAVTFVLSSDGIDITGGYIKHNGKRIDATHKHGGVQVGGSQTDLPS